MSDLQHERITALAVELRLGAMADLYGAIAQDAAKRKAASYADFLEQVLRAERDARRVRSASMLARTAGFPAIKTLEDYDFGFATGAPKAQIHELASLGFVERTENVVMLGPSGIVTADAMHTQRTTAKTIKEKGGDWLMVLKGNQGTLFEDVSLFLGDPGETGNITSFQTVDADHGRIETRIARVCTDIDWLKQRHDWPGLQAIATITATREINGAASTTTRHYISSLALTPDKLLHIARSHWAIENSLHWVLDVAMNEDSARNRTGNGPENLALLRRIALNLARAETSKGSMRGKLKRAAWNDDFILNLIRAARTR